VTDWTRVMPDSPYALAAAAMQNYHRAFDLRGGLSAGNTHSDALFLFYGALEMGFESAFRANQLAANFVPASDAILLIGADSTLLSYEHHSLIANNTMRLTPNLGSLRRIARYDDPRWGGSGYERT